MCIASTHTAGCGAAAGLTSLCVCVRACESCSLTASRLCVCVCNSRLYLGLSTPLRGPGLALAICLGQMGILSCISSVTPLWGHWGGGPLQCVCKTCLALSEHSSCQGACMLLHVDAGLFGSRICKSVSARVYLQEYLAVRINSVSRARKFIEVEMCL